jgi:hypothetical protein
MGLNHQYQRSRYEFKYLIDEPRARQVRDFVRSYLRRDEHAQPEKRHAYPIYSLYLDSPGLSLYHATVQAQMNRFKLRVRYYDNQPESPVFCEIKRRVNDVILKDRAQVRRGALEELFAGRSASPDDLFDPGDTDSYSALRKFCDLRNALHAEPRIVVYFEREAWISADDDATRVTFDRSAAAAHWRNQFEPSHLSPAKVPDVILELKFDDRFPLWMREMVAGCNLFRTPMSKYRHCMESIPRAARPFATPIFA